MGVCGWLGSGRGFVIGGFGSRVHGWVGFCKEGWRWLEKRINGKEGLW